jgi:predicted outer membrane repeat protein
MQHSGDKGSRVRGTDPAARDPDGSDVGFRRAFPISRCDRVRAGVPATAPGIVFPHPEAVMSRVRLVCLTLTLAAVAGCEAASPIMAPSPESLRPSALIGTVVTVQNTNDAGPGSLRQAIADAVGDETIQFDAAIAGQTIVLTTGPLMVMQPVTIEGPQTTGMTISGNGASRVMVTQANGVVLRNLTITGGKSIAPGGGVVNSGKLTIDHSTITGNETAGLTGIFLSDGGGVLNVGSSSVLVVLNSTISGNAAENSGGGIYSQGLVELINSTVAFNRAKNGGGIEVSGASLLLMNSVIAKNTATAVGANCGPSLLLVNYLGTNISEDGSCGTDPALLFADPILGPLASNGGPTQTHALLLGSPAIEAATSCNVTTDQRYVARPQPVGGACDIGAFEFTDFLTAAVVIDASVTVNPRTGTAVVSGTVACSRQVAADLEVTLHQPQKVGRVSATIKATDLTTVDCVGTKYWSVALAAASGGFQTGAATATVKTTTLDKWYVPATATSAVKLYWGRK